MSYQWIDKVESILRSHKNLSTKYGESSVRDITKFRKIDTGELHRLLEAVHIALSDLEYRVSLMEESRTDAKEEE